jgi:adenine-specific DNA-methyltransferase
MAKQYKGSLSLDWYNKQKAILLRTEAETKTATDIPAPIINWVNKDDALFYEINQVEGRGIAPYWVDRNDIRVKEARPLIFQKAFKAVAKDKEGSLPGMVSEFKIEEINHDDAAIENILIKGDNLLALNTLKKIFDNKPEEEKVKCVFTDPPYNTGQAFENYDDNLAQSEWLTLMRDRIVILHSILRGDGLFFMQLDEKNLFHIRVLLDEIFGKGNFVNIFTVKTSDPSGLKTVNPSPYDAAEYILMYAKDKSNYKYETIHIPCSHDEGYSKYISNIDEDYKKWTVENINEYYAKMKGFANTNEAKKCLGKLDFLNEVSNYAINNSKSVFQLTAIADDAGQEIVLTRDKSKASQDKIFKVNRDDKDIYVLNGRQMYFYSNKVRLIEGVLTPTIQLTNIWNDIPYNGISKEGGVKFKESKKPEKLIKRIFDVAKVNVGDYVLDPFGGSGTTYAVAHKQGFKWVGIEIGNHAETHILKRMNSILDNSDQSGVSNLVKWKGGGSFKYYNLGESIIKLNEDGTGDFNWSLGKQFIQESFLSSYDYIIDTSIDFKEGELFADKKHQPLVGVQTIGTKKRVAVIALNEPKGKLETLSYEEMQSIYKTVKKKFSPEYINIFTNRGIEIAYDSKPDDLEVVKIPNAIFTELEK